MKYTISEKVTITAWIISFEDQSIEYSRRKFAKEFNKPAPFRSTLRDWKKKLLETGNLADCPIYDFPKRCQLCVDNDGDLFEM